jgi:hypothetical protein
MPRMTKKALTQMGRLLEILQINRALTDREVVDQLNTIQDEEAGARNHKPITMRAWQYWKHGQKQPWPLHLRVLATWTNVPVGVIRLGHHTIGRDGSVSWPYSDLD